eukprot:CAMPEP_0184645724 /NCGR_PEP_ID=MMETSP0308-20130426/2288_1 /TAXON_ID=38269 /ORGANISM="Gloeochaete witrockiana, Strain SAG 46.84" /LENGTH=192 /DNA_ID=CAMNT_0027075043 /DNA_START=125 /DNA_END=700 /DNA_ORIENTATION=-
MGNGSIKGGFDNFPEEETQEKAPTKTPRKSSKHAATTEQDPIPHPKLDKTLPPQSRRLQSRKEAPEHAEDGIDLRQSTSSTGRLPPSSKPRRTESRSNAPPRAVISAVPAVPAASAVTVQLANGGQRERLEGPLSMEDLYDAIATKLQISRDEILYLTVGSSTGPKLATSTVSEEPLYVHVNATDTNEDDVW